MKKGIHPMAVILTACLFLGGKYAIHLLLIAIVCGVIYSVVKSIKTGSYKEMRTTDQLVEWSKESQRLKELYPDKYVWDKNSLKHECIHDERYIEAKRALDNKYAIKGSEEYDRIRERERNWMK